ncbi:ATP-grasp domain-containing protein [Elusimicrobiota bacterium]
MRLYEYEAKKIFKETGISVPKQYGLIRGPEDLKGLKAGFPCMIKAMVLTGGRGKAGGIKKAGSVTCAGADVRSMLKSDIKGQPVNAVLIEEAISPIDASCYLGVTVNPATFNNVLIASASGGVDIEETAGSSPEAIMKKELPENTMELPASYGRQVARFLNRTLKGNARLEKELARAVSLLYELYQKYDCKVAEINPLLISGGKAVAADAKVVLDDNALYRQSALLEKLGAAGKRHDSCEATANEQRAQEAGIPYVDLLPEGFKKARGKLYVGLVPGGAGYGIFSIDEVVNIGRRYFKSRVVPVNFMDSGGGPGIGKVAEMFNILMDHDAVDIIITSRFGGISSCDIFIRGLIKCMRERHEKGLRLKPVIGRMVGTDLPGARAFLDKALKETPGVLKDLDMTVGNREIFARVIRKGIKKGFDIKKGRS